MAKYRNNLPLNAKDRIFLSEGGMMTSFFFGEETKDIKVPECNLFFHFIKDEKIMNWASNYNRKFLDLCLKENDEFGCVLVAFFQYKARKQDVKEVLDIDEEEWVQLNKDYVQRLVDLRSEYESSIPNCPPIPIGGLVVPKGEKGDCFSMDTRMNIDEAEEYHKDQIKMIAEDTMADFLLFALASYSEDVIGVCNVAARYQLPVVVSFTTGTDGRLYGGETIKDAIKAIDTATGAISEKNKPFYYMINCSHITHFGHIFEEKEGQEYIKRIGALKPNGSKKSQAELNNSTTLDTGDHVEFGELLAKFQQKTSPQINWLSGCCGTDMRHLKETIKCLKKK